MSPSTTCQKCGTLNAEWAKFCAKCGNPLTTTLPPPGTQSQIPGPYAQAVPPPWYSYTPTATYAFQQRTEIDRTKTGLLLLMIGTILGPVPIITYIGGLLSLIGAILVILGRKAFGPEHSRNAIWSIIIYIFGFVIIVVGVIAFTFAIISATITTRSGTVTDLTVIAQSLTSSFNALLIAGIIGGAVISIAYVLFTYQLQNQNGKIILWAAYASSIAVGIINAIIISALLSDAVQRSIAGGIFNPDPLRGLQNQFQALGLLGFIPAALWATALYLVWSRIGRGELPATTPAPPSPTFSPPAPPTPPPTSPAVPPQ